MAEGKSKVFVIRPKDEATSRFVDAAGDQSSARLVRAKRVSQVEAHIAQDFEIAVATPDDLHKAGKDGVEIEQAVD